MGGATLCPSPMSSTPCEAARSVAEGLSATVFHATLPLSEKGAGGEVEGESSACSETDETDL